MSSMIAGSESKKAIYEQAVSEGFTDMFQDGIIRAARGITTLDEITRVAKS
jgi:general secretion pathway protein E